MTDTPLFSDIAYELDMYAGQSVQALFAHHLHQFEGWPI